MNQQRMRDELFEKELIQMEEARNSR